MARGGRRAGAGRPATGRTTTKVTVYIEDRDILNDYARRMGIPVNEYIHRVLHHKDFGSLHHEIFFKNLLENNY